jgi:hypothetical protein
MRILSKVSLCGWTLLIGADAGRLDFPPTFLPRAPPLISTDAIPKPATHTDPSRPFTAILGN